MNSRDITVYLDTHWCDALEAHTGKTMEALLTEQMDTLIQQLPKDQREQIAQEIHQEEQERAQEAEASRHFSITRITENGESRCLLLEHGEIMFQTAQRLRRYLRGELDDPSQFYGDAAPIPQEEMERYTAELLRGSPRVVGIYDIDLDAGEVYSLDPSKGWRGYQIKDVSTAVYFATKRESDDWIAKRARFQDRLKAIEFPFSVRPIMVRGNEPMPAEGFTFSQVMAERRGVIYGYILADFDREKVFGLHVGQENPGYTNLCFNYDLMTGCITDSLGISFLQEGQTMLQCEYRLSPEEQEHIRSRLDEHFQTIMGLSLEEYRDQYLPEAQCPTPHESPQQSGPIFHA